MDIQFKAESIIDGLVLPFDKPYGWTSFDLVNYVRKKLSKATGLKKIKVGHTGTLDPLATGLLILCTGRATRSIDSIQAMNKEYEAEITLGATTPSFDLETDIDNTYSTDHITDLLIRSKIGLFVGAIKQVPPAFSAKKMEGKRAYEYAREGIKKNMGYVDVEIFDIEIIDFQKPVLKLRVTCSKGTYIRSLAHDLGKKLNSGGHLTALRRTAIGEYNIKHTIDIKIFEKKLNIL